MEQLDIIVFGLTLFSSLLLHIISDFHLQGIFCDLKQSSWWERKCNELGCNYATYKNDFIMCLYLHAFEWACFIFLPIFVVTLAYFHIYEWYVWIAYLGTLFLNMDLHARIDHAKANLGVLNLIADQALHIGQILVTWGLFVFEICCVLSVRTHV